MESKEERNRIVNGMQKVIDKYIGKPFSPIIIGLARAELLAFLKPLVYERRVSWGPTHESLRVDPTVPPAVIPFIPLILDGCDTHGTYNLVMAGQIVGSVSYSGEHVNTNPTRIFFGCEHTLIQYSPLLWRAEE